ncbi:DNA integrity scanning protein DisA nucleotide-binding domain protein [[Mycoplasma] gypis]|uniref:DNA integrity scanning protein DisA nucleotide-binding domain protein n=1 Tax=[Mycoplasma] gypis TaxID=92404 RepID=A0ABZ2RU14_9BACT|nr:DNA integrity scanning protein DisA nucleotide-binding domain protein [[Mycoplasma] gypis]MBN0919091.1 DNA integrity scanning protein DisA nucleotide-binding domain protein [[Mycoplasma] gypis]
MNSKIIYVILIFVILIFALISAHYVFNFFKSINKIGKSRKKVSKSSKIRLIHQLKESLEFLSKTKTGAIITIEMNEKLDSLRTDGVIIDANISSSLIISIFNKHTPLHDGAIIIRDNKILYAATYYKITKKSIDNRYGARHRAALGISEISDSVTLVVSEESGNITLARNGSLTTIANEQLQESLVNIFKDY